MAACLQTTILTSYPQPSLLVLVILAGSRPARSPRPGQHQPLELDKVRAIFSLGPALAALA